MIFSQANPQKPWPAALLAQFNPFLQGDPNAPVEPIVRLCGCCIMLCAVVPFARAGDGVQQPADQPGVYSGDDGAPGQWGDGGLQSEQLLPRRPDVEPSGPGGKGSACARVCRPVGWTGVLGHVQAQSNLSRMRDLTLWRRKLVGLCGLEEQGANLPVGCDRAQGAVSPGAVSRGQSGEPAEFEQCNCGEGGALYDQRDDCGPGGWQYHHARRREHRGPGCREY